MNPQKLIVNTQGAVAPCLGEGVGWLAWGVVWLGLLFLAGCGGAERLRFDGHGGGILSVSVNRDRVLSAAGDGSAFVWDWHNGAILRRFPSHGQAATAAAFSPDGDLAILAYADGSIRVYSLVTGEQLVVQEDLADVTMDAVFAPDGDTLVTATWLWCVYEWDVRRGGLLHKKGTGDYSHNGVVESVALSPDGTLVATASRDKTVALWQVGSDADPIQVFEGHTRTVNDVVFHPNGDQLATASSDGTLMLWDVASGESLRRYTGHTDRVRSILFTPDGTRLISAGDDRTIRIWDVQTGQELRRLTGHSDAVWRLAITPDGRNLLSGSLDQTVRVWDLTGE